MLSGQEASNKPVASTGLPRKLLLRAPPRVAENTRQQLKSLGALAGGETGPLTGRIRGDFWCGLPAAISAYQWFDDGVLRTQRPELLDFEAWHCASVSKAHFCPPPATRHQS